MYPKEFELKNGMIKFVQKNYKFLSYHKINISLFQFLLLFSVLSIMSSLKYYNLNTAFFDLGVFMSHFSGYTLMGINKLFYGHSQPLIIVYEFFYKLFPEFLSPYFILIFQSFALCLPIFIISKLYKPIFSWGYLLIFPIWYNALFDFHIDHLVIILQFLFFYFFKKSQYGKATIASCSMIFIKEVFALQTGMSSIYFLIYILINLKNPKIKSQLPILMFYTLTLFLIGFGYFYFATTIIIPHFSLSNHNAIEMANSFSWLGGSITEIIYNIFKNPFIVLDKIVLDQDKLIYLLVVFGGFGFSAFISPLPIIIAFPILGIALISELPNHSAFYNHYTCGIVAPFFISLCDTVEKIKFKFENNKFVAKNIFKFFIISLIFTNILLSPSPIGWIFWSNIYWQFGYSAYYDVNKERTNIIKTEISNLFKEDKKSIISVQNSINYSAIINRPKILVFPSGVFQKTIIPEANFIDWTLNTTYKTVIADYVIIDFKKPLFIGDKGCKWRNNMCTDKLQLIKVQSIFKKLLKTHKTIFHYDRFYIFKK